MLNKSIFRSYDIRGIYPGELDKETAFEIGRAFIKRTGAKSVVIGYDSRLPSPVLFEALAAGLQAEGSRVSSIGMVPTECLYFATASYDFDGGIMVTASHNPKEYDGFKLIKKEGENIRVLSGEEFLPLIEAGKYQPQEVEIENKDIWKDYLNHVLNFVNLAEIAPLKIVVDASNGVGGLSIEKIKDKLPVEIIDLNFKPDGNFPNHSPNPFEDGSIDQIAQKIKEAKADCGFIFDGDADRIFLVDENGKLVSSDVTILLLAKYFLEKNPGMAIVKHATCSKAIDEFVKKWGGVPIKTKVGFIHIQQGLKDNNGIMGGELSGHYSFRDNFYSDSGMIAFLTLLWILSKDRRKISEIVKELSPYYKPQETNFKVTDKEGVIEKIKQKYSGAKQDFLDGITVEYPDWWFNVRPSNNEPLLRLTLEANTKELLEEKKKELSDFIITKNPV